MTLVESTSPNALLTASLDAARRQNVVAGRELLAETIASLKVLRARIVEIPGLDVLDEEIAEAESVFAWDPLRVSVDVRGTGATGNKIARFMREEHDIWFELYAENVVVAVFGIGENVAATGARLLAGLRDAAEKLRTDGGEPRAAVRAAAALGAAGDDSARRLPRARRRRSPSTVAEGRIAAESLAAYPPGVPNVLPGERLSRATLDFIADSLAHGGQVRGASDRTLGTIRVVIE